MTPRSFVPRALLAVALTIELGCGGSTSPDAPDASSGGAACVIVAASYDQSCKTDSDCALVPPGGNVCDPSSNGTGCLVCDLAAVNVGSQEAYATALQKGIAQHPPSYATSCPTGMTAVCDAGGCTTSAGSLVCN
jgi:hypothetical protein